MIVSYVIVFILAFVLNLLPFFTPPTWTVLAYFHLQWDLVPWILALGGAVVAAGGRYILARCSGWVYKYFPKKYQENIDYLRKKMAHHSRKVVAFSFIYAAVLPISSSQFFVAVGLAKVPLKLITLAFFIGRFISYLIMIMTTGYVAKRFEDIFAGYYNNWTIAVLELLSILFLVFLVKIDWQLLWEKHKFGLK